jgi:signal transduction histidine kinase
MDVADWPARPDRPLRRCGWPCCRRGPPARHPLVGRLPDHGAGIERDLHDGLQQRLVSLELELRAAHAAVPTEFPALGAQLARVAEGLEELRELSRGIHPAILSEGGLGPALGALTRRSAVPVELEVHVEARLPAPVEIAASVAHVEVQARGGRLRLWVADDGDGGADPARGSGLVGLGDRVQALGGTLTVHSPAGAGTRLLVDLPIEVDRG